MTLFEQCVEAVEPIIKHGGPVYDLEATTIVRAVLQTIADHSPSIRTQDEMRRILAEASHAPEVR